MRFTKMNGAGNDFILVENLHGELTQQQLSKLARTLCDRRMSIGADGLMAIVPAKANADFGMLFFNCDGTRGEMCGNGARCICRYGYETGLAGETQTIETTAGLVTGTRIDAKNYRIRLPDPVNLQYLALDVDGKKVGCMYLELGNPGIPHAVVQYPGLREADEQALFEFGASSGTIRHSQRAPMSISSKRPAKTGFMNGPGSGAWRISPTPAARGRRVGLRAGGKAPVRRSCGGRSERGSSHRGHCPRREKMQRPAAHRTCQHGLHGRDF